MSLNKPKNGTNPSSEETVVFPGPVPGKVVYVIEPNKFVSEGHILLKVKFQEDLKGRRGRDSIRAPNAGKILKVDCGVNSVLNPGDIVFTMSKECPHTTLLKGLCAVCGADVYRNMERQSNAMRHDEKSEQKKPFAEAWRDKLREGLPVIHHVPELIVSKEYAAELGQQDQTRLLNERRLVLLVDLDETIIHTTDFRVDHAALDPSKRDEVTTFNIHGKVYHTKLRPHCRQFLAQIQSLYELHICTFGNREYAHNIASFIDPGGKLFSHRILSRNELIDVKSKTGNLKALFPCGDEMICIIDDRPDMWNHASNLIHVEPYIYFQNQGDINAPPHAAEREKAAASRSPNGNSSSANASTPLPAKIDGFARPGPPVANGASTDAARPTTTAAANSTIAVIPTTDDDNYLVLLEQQLKHLHEYWYKQYDLLQLSVPAAAAPSSKKLKRSSRKPKDSTSQQQVYVPSSRLPSLKVIMPAIRKTVLRGCRVYVCDEAAAEQRDQQNRYMHRLRYDECAGLLGACVEHDSSRLSSITHIVSEQRPSSTAIMGSSAASLGLRYVTPQWLTKSFYSWKRQDEARFIPTRVSNQAFVNDAEVNSMSNSSLRTAKPSGVVTAGNDRAVKPPAMPLKRNADDLGLYGLQSMEDEIAAEFPDEFADEESSDADKNDAEIIKQPLPAAEQQNITAQTTDTQILSDRRHIMPPPPDPDVVRQRSERIARTLAQLQRQGRRPIASTVLIASRSMTQCSITSSHSVNPGMILAVDSSGATTLDADAKGADVVKVDSKGDNLQSKISPTFPDKAHQDDAMEDGADYDATANIVSSGSDNSEDDEDDEQLEEKWSGVCLDDL